MVLLTMTSSIVEGLQVLNRAANPENDTNRAQGDGHGQPGTERGPEPRPEPSLKHPAIGNPVSHAQVVDLWKVLKDAGHREYTLERLLKGSTVHVPPSVPKPQPSDEYKALMARLRREQEEREYERMTNPLPPTETFAHRYPNGAKMAQAFAAVNRPSQKEDMGDDDITYRDVHRQLMLILNFVASILGVAATLWIVARWWSTPARLFLTMGGSFLVGVAEVAVYSGYVWHLGQAKKKDKTLKEVKEIVQTWTVGPDGEAEDEAEDEPEPVAAGGTTETRDTTLRRRRKDAQ